MIRERSLKIALVVLWALVVVILLGFGLKLLRDSVLAPDEASSFFSFPRVTKAEERDVTIYFADENATGLVPEKRRARLGVDTATDALTIMSELMRGPQSAGYYSTIPSDTRLLNAYALGNTLVLDFTHELQTNHPGGSTGELLTVYSIVNTMTMNLHGIRRVKILVEGEEVETLAGHLDLSKALIPDAKWAEGQLR